MKPLVLWLVAVSCWFQQAQVYASGSASDWIDQPAKAKRPGQHLVKHHAVSLRQLEKQAREWQRARPRSEKALTLGGLTDVVGYRWDSSNRDLLIIGEIGEGEPILLDEFVKALQVADEPSIFLTLRPERPDQPRSRQLVEVYPPKVNDSRLIAVALKADYTAKDKAFNYLYERFQEIVKRDPSSTENALTMARIFFVPAKPKLEFSKEGNSFTVSIREASVVLVPEQDIAAAVGTVSQPLPESHPLSQFAEEFTRNFETKKQEYPVFRHLHAIYKLFLVAQCLRAEKIPANLSFWLSEYPLNPYPIPRELPGFKPRQAEKTFWGLPYARTEWEGVKRVQVIWGGVLVGYSEYIVECWRSWGRGSPNIWSVNSGSTLAAGLQTGASTSSTMNWDATSAEKMDLHLVAGQTGSRAGQGDLSQPSARLYSSIPVSVKFPSGSSSGGAFNSSPSLRLTFPQISLQTIQPSFFTPSMSSLGISSSIRYPSGSTLGGSSTLYSPASQLNSMNTGLGKTWQAPSTPNWSPIIGSSPNWSTIIGSPSVPKWSPNNNNPWNNKTPTISTPPPIVHDWRRGW